MRGSSLPAVLVLLLGTLALMSGCASESLLPPNPFRTAPMLLADVSPTPPPATVSPTETPVPFAPYWVKNHRQTEMWSGPAGRSGVVSFGQTTNQFCVFQVLLPQDGSRLFVLNPFVRGQFWIDADAVGPVAEPPQRAQGPKPAGQNCAGVLYD